MGAIQALRPAVGRQGLESAIISRCKDRDVDAFGLLVDRYQSRVYGFVRRMVPNSEDAEDIAQEVFVRAFQSIQRFDGRASFATWLFRIAANLCIDRARRRERRPEQVPLASGEDAVENEPPDARWNPEGSAMAGEMEWVIEQAVGALSEKLRSVLLLHDLESLSYGEIALALGLPVGTVKSRLFLARNRLQTALKAYLALGEPM